MRDGDQFQRVQDYTFAFLGMFYLTLMFTLMVIWGVWGYLVSLALCLALHWVLRRWGNRRAAREADWDARVATIVARARRG